MTDNISTSFECHEEWNIIVKLLFIIVKGGNGRNLGKITLTCVLGILPYIEHWKRICIHFAFEIKEKKIH